jgi:hypothetical protein
MSRPSKLVQDAKEIDQNHNAYLQSFFSRYELAHIQIRQGQKVEIDVKELEKDYMKFRVESMRLVNQVNNLKNAIIDLVD